jgi:uncharacterized membrane protein
VGIAHQVKERYPSMKSIACAIVIFSGCLLWASGVIADALAYSNKVSLDAAQVAIWGGIIVVVTGFIKLFKSDDGPSS